ncbi:MAG: ferrochelatase, partial [Halobacteriaceae archaeon]
LHLSDYALGFQNHENRDIPWTEPEIETVIENLDCTQVVVEPISFMHEQSETLSELDIELQEKARSNGLEFNRVPIPYDDDKFSSLLADLVEPFVTDMNPSYYQYRQCVCRNSSRTFCLNAPWDS